MEEYQHIISLIALTMGASWASGLNLYATLAILGFSGTTGAVDLPVGLEVLQNPLIIGAAVVMYIIDFVVAKIPGADTAWDGLHTFIRIPAGAMLASGAIGDAGPVMEIAAIIMGGGLSATSHVTKAGSRAVINTSPEPLSNWGASISEDVAVFGGMWAALNHSVLFLVFLLLFILFVIWLLPKIWRAAKGILGFIGRLFGGGDNPPPAAEPSDTLTQLERLKQLFDSGALTESEYLQQKQKLLDG